jgi:hypothetical protein
MILKMESGHGPFGSALPLLLVPKIITSCEGKLLKTKKKSYKRLFVIG